MTTGDFDTYYSDQPWAAIDKNQREWYDPELISVFRNKALFAQLIPFVKNLGDVRATKMHMTQLFDPHPDYTPLNLRQLWMPAAHVDSRSIEIEFARYGGKVAYMKYDDMITYWKQNGTEGLRKIMRGALGQHMVETLDLLARNAFLEGSLGSGYTLYQGTATDFSGLAVTDKFDPAIAMDIWLGMANRGVANALGPNGAEGNIVCYTTPGVIFDIQNGAGGDAWVAAHEYANPEALLKYEVGSYKNVRFIQHPLLTLWNTGEVIAQGSVSVAIHAGDGSPNPATTKVDNTYRVGQTTGGIVHSISVGSWGTGTIADISVNDMITIHTTRTSDYGVTDGVDPFEGTAHVRRVVAKTDASPDLLVLDRPIMVDMDTDLGGGVYAYVTKGRTIHSSIFVGSNEGIVAGVAQPPRVYAPPPVDDFESVYRFSWDAFQGYQTYAPEVFEVVFSAGSTRVKGATQVV